MDRKTGFIYLLLDYTHVIVREHDSTTNYRGEVANIGDMGSPLNWLFYDGTQVSFVIEGDKAVAVEKL